MGARGGIDREKRMKRQEKSKPIQRGQGVGAEKAALADLNANGEGESWALTKG